MSDDFRNRTLAGIGWNTLLQGSRQALQFIIGIILARLLTPDAFGLIGMIAVFAGFANVFTDLGFKAALIQKQDADQRHYSSVLWFNIGFGLVMTILMIALAPSVATFYGEELLGHLTMLIALRFFIDSLYIVQHALLLKQLNFRLLAIVNIVAMMASGATAITLALLGFGVWSLAIQTVMLSTITMILMWSLSSWRPSLVFDWVAVRELWGFSSNLLGFSVINYWMRNADNLLIGRFLGSASLGIYSKSYALLLFPITNISGTISQVMFPSLSRIQDDRPRLQRVYLRTTAAIALVTFPMMLGLLVLAEDFVLAVFGAQWIGMIPILQVFCIVGMIQSVITLNGNLYLSQGRTDLQFKVGAVVGLIGVGAIVLGLNWGVHGVAYAYALAVLLLAYPSIRIAVSLIGLTFREVAANLAGITCCASAMALLVWAAGRLLPSAWPHWAYLAVQVPFGIVVYWGLNHTFKVQAYRDVRTLAAEQARLRQCLLSVKLKWKAQR